MLANDSDVDGDELTIASVDATSAEGGTVSFDGTTITYTPAEGFNGEDSFTYTVDDGNDGTATATVTVSVGAVNDAPIATDDTFAGTEDNPIAGNVIGNLEPNGADSDPDGDQLLVTAVTV